jgi:hypothetical protein
LAIGGQPALPYVEARMVITNLSTNVSRIEVSGWDEDETFFVEKSEFAYDEVAGKHITLQHNLPEGSLIFLRLIHSPALQHSIPVAYKTHFIGWDFQGNYRFSLIPAHPLHAASHFSVN